MAFDGMTVRALAEELNNTIVDGRISKISQPEKDEIILTIRGIKKDKKLIISANPSLPLICFVNESKLSGNNAPAFCMLLRKHIQNGKITKVSQVDFERVIKIQIEHRNEMGDMAYKYLMVEIMGKHSNLLLIDEKNIILDAIKRITPDISSVRTVLPYEPYFIPTATDKLNPLSVSVDEMITKISKVSAPLSKAIYESITGFSPMLANEVCTICGIDYDISANTMNKEISSNLKTALTSIISLIKENIYTPYIYYDYDGKPRDFTVFYAKTYSNLKAVQMDYISDTLLHYYYEKAKNDRLRQKSSDLRQLINNLLAKSINKLSLQEKQLNDTKKREKYKLFGELLNVYSYDIPKKASFYEADNYYDDNKKVKISLDPNLSPNQNSVKYFEKYSKAKRTFDALSKLIPETKQQTEYLKSILMYLNKLKSEDDISALKEDLTKNGFLKKHSANQNKKLKKQSKLQPLHYLSPNGKNIYVGRNNLQNDELSFKFAGKNDWWFHAKSIAGSHVILKNEDNTQIADEDFEAAARLAAYYSSSEENKVEIDYTQKKHLIKPPAAPSGYVIYHTNFSMLIDNDISQLRLME